MQVSQNKPATIVWHEWDSSPWNWMRGFHIVPTHCAARRMNHGTLCTNMGFPSVLFASSHLTFMIYVKASKKPLLRIVYRQRNAWCLMVRYFIMSHHHFSSLSHVMTNCFREKRRYGRARLKTFGTATTFLVFIPSCTICRMLHVQNSPNSRSGRRLVIWSEPYTVISRK